MIRQQMNSFDLFRDRRFTSLSIIDFSRFGSLIDLSTNGPNSSNEWTINPSSSAINDVSSSLSISTSASIQPDMTIPSAVIDEE